MSENITITSNQIMKAVESLKELRPVYGTILDFYGQIFVAQEDSKCKLHIDPIQISEEMLSIKAEENFPLINMSEFAIDAKEAGNLLIRICDIVKKAGGDMVSTNQTVLKAIEAGKFDQKELFASLLNEDDAFFENTAKELEIEKKALAFIAYNSLKPSLSMCAEQLSAYLDKDKPWGKGYCPICGSSPGLSMFQGEGERFLICGFCWHKWASNRIFCPFCDNTDTKTLNYFFSEDEKEYRVDLCDGCKKYIKTVDTRKAERIIYPPLEQVATLHLDIKAKEMKYESGIHFA
ncbi:MAG: formate dehydrogenase accessory protein FdhE [Desulfobacteraceae bacterium]|uniref:Formate dehydrogenase accessory protein FdhE n=1 Tax=Candidatus Desulfaltia bathyphila TaxID=2841697 RepID=A0A8J6N3R6_9BACT|nr:formate dehydrogenase accessory protein FdhE [Candidatus Desulfaltia bathyphila]MBL7195088.1 formate dehydrogenase accessory protein FdhE [Desulfobacterales bacterium]